MAFALTSISPRTVLDVFTQVPNRLNLPNGQKVMGVSPGWTNGTYALVTVVPFVVPGGQMTVGNPSYNIDVNGVVTETYPTTTEILTWSPIKIIKALQAINKTKADLFISKMSNSDQARFSSATSVAENSALLIAALAEPSVNITMAQLKTAINNLVGNGAA